MAVGWRWVGSSSNDALAEGEEEGGAGENDEEGMEDGEAELEDGDLSPAGPV